MPRVQQSHAQQKLVDNELAPPMEDGNFSKSSTEFEFDSEDDVDLAMPGRDFVKANGKEYDLGSWKGSEHDGYGRIQYTYAQEWLRLMDS